MTAQKRKISDGPSQFRTTGHPTHISPFSFVDWFLWFWILPLSFSWVFFVAPVRERLHYPLLKLGQMVSVASWELKFLDHWTQSWEGKCWVQRAAALVAVWWQQSQVSRWAKKIQCLVQMSRVLSGGYKRPGSGRGSFHQAWHWKLI